MLCQKNQNLILVLYSILEKIYYYQIVSDFFKKKNNTGDWVNEQNDGSTFKFEVFKPPKIEHFGWENFLYFFQGETIKSQRVEKAKT